MNMFNIMFDDSEVGITFIKCLESRLDDCFEDLAAPQMPNPETPE